MQVKAKIAHGCFARSSVKSHSGTLLCLQVILADRSAPLLSCLLSSAPLLSAALLSPSLASPSSLSAISFSGDGIALLQNNGFEEFDWKPRHRLMRVSRLKICRRNQTWGAVLRCVVPNVLQDEACGFDNPVLLPSPTDALLWHGIPPSRPVPSTEAAIDVALEDPNVRRAQPLYKVLRVYF